MHFFLKTEAEFVRITTVPLVSKFLAQLDQHTAKLIQVFNNKGGSAGTKIQQTLRPMAEVGFVICENIFNGDIN